MDYRQEHDRRVSWGLLDLVNHRYLFSFIPSVLVSVALIAMLWPTVRKKYLLIWLVSLWSVMAIRTVYTRYYLKRVALEGYGRWKAGLVAGAAAAGSCWGGAVFFLSASSPESAMLPLLFVIAGVTAYACITMAAERSAVSAFILSALLPVIFWMFSHAGQQHAYMGMITMIYMGALMLLSRSLHDVIRNSISVEESNRELKAALEQVKALEYRAAQLQVDRSYSDLFDNFEDNIFFVDVAEQGGFTVASINPAAEISFGIRRQDACGKKKSELFPPELAARLEAYDQACVDSGKPVHYEEVLDHPTGRRYYSITHIPMWGETGRISRIAAISRDITERKKSDALLQKKEEQFRALAENSPDPIYRYDSECRRVYVNQTVERLTGVPAATLLGKSPTEMATSHIDDATMSQKNIQHVLDSGKSGEFELCLSTVDERELVIHHLLVPEFSADGSVESVLVIGRDITARKRMEEVLRRSERDYRMLAENSPDNVIRYDRDLRIRYLNKNMETLLAIPATFILGKTPSEAFSDGMFDELEMIMKGMIISGEGADYYITLPDGNGERYQHIRLRPEKNELGEVTGILAIGHDITELKRAEVVLKENEARYRSSSNLLNSILESSPDVISFALDCDYRYIAFNNLHRLTMQALWNKEITLGMSMLDVIGEHPDRNSAILCFGRALRGECFGLEQAYGDEQFSREYWQNYYSPICTDAGQITGLTCFSLNVTENRHVSQALAESESRYHQIFEHSHEGLFLLDVTEDQRFRLIEVNPAFERLFSVTQEALIGRFTEEILPAGMAEMVNDKYRHCLRSGTLFEEELELELPAGKRTYLSMLVPVRNEHGRVLRISGMIRDVTEQCLYEQTLLERAELEQRLSSYINSVPGFFFTLQKTADGIMSMPFASIGIASIFALRPEDVAVSVDSILLRYHPEDTEQILQKVEFSGKTLTPCHVEFRVLSQDTDERWVEARSMPHRDEDGNIRWHGFMQDITERKRIENALFDNEHLLQEAQRIAHVGSWEVDMLKDKLIWSDEIFRIWEIDKSEFKANFAAFLETVHPEDRGGVTTAYNDAILNRSIYEIEHRLLFPDGRIKYILERGEPQFNTQGESVRFIGTSLDITERKRMEEALSTREREFRSLAENMSDNIARWDVQGRYIYVNPTHEKTLGVSANEIIGKQLSDTHEHVKAAIAQVVETGLAVELVRQPVAVDGEMQIHEVSLSPERDAEGRIVSVLGLGRNMTEIYRMQDSIASSAQEFRTLVEQAPEPIFRYAPDGRRTYVNAAVERITGLSADVLLGGLSADGKVVPSRQGAAVTALVRRICETGEPGEIEVENVGADGIRRNFLNRLAPEFGADGKVRSVFSISHDISELKRVETSLKEKYARIVELNEYLEENTRNLEEQAVELEAQAVELEASQEQIKLTEAWYRSIIHAAPDGMLVVDAKGIIRLVNSQISDMFGYEHGELNGYPIELLLPLDVRENHLRHRTDFFASDVQGRPMTGTLNCFRGYRRDGSEFPVDVSLARLPDMEGQVGAICATIRDITERRRVENALALREKEFRTLVENTPDVIVRYDRECRRTYVNPEWVRVNGIPMAEVLGKTPQEISIHVKPIAVDFELKLRDVMARGHMSDMDLLWHDEAGKQVCFALSMIPEFDSSGDVNSVLTVARDFSERRRMEDALAIKEHESRTLIDNSPDNISRYDRDCRRIYANPTYGAMVDGGVAALLGKKPSELPGGVDAGLYEAKINEVFSTGQMTEFELKWSDSMGREVCSHVRLAPEYDKAGNVVSVLTVGRDITELNYHRKRIHQMAFYDTLTNLPNRVLFNERLHQMLNDVSLHKQLGGVMLLDLDRFKVVNDTLGHSAGDDLLRDVALRLTHCVRGYDTVARLGGDEFAILLPEIRSVDDLGRIAGKILESFNDPFILSGKEVFIRSSIGISIYPLDSLNADDLLKQADSAMYLAKRSGRNNFRFYSSGMTETANERMVLEVDLRRGFVRDELILYFQPKVRLEDGKMIGSEALLRWKHPERGMIQPDKFISIAEDCGLIVEIGEWVLHHACLVACEWNANGRQHKLAINLSARQFQSNDLLKTVRNVLAETGCKPEWIELEITESLLLDEEGDVLTTLEAFRQMGICIAIDDFGTGYSALSYLARFPIDTLKIDRSFTCRITESGHHAELVKAIISIAKCLNQQVVAEGAETAEEVALLKSYGCHFVQGYFYGKPVPQSAFEANFN